LFGAECLAAEGLGTIGGTVFSAVSGAPLASSSVTLAQADGAPLRSLPCDRRGRYLFSGLAAGLYRVSAVRPGFARGSHGPVIELGRGGGVTADIWLHRLGVITGSVVDENGEGIPGLTVHAVMGRVSSAGITDDRGVYRIVGLRPGRYSVSSAPRQLEDGTGLLPTYAPGVLERREARVVEVGLDQEAAGVHIRPVGGRLLRLSGVVARGGPARVALYQDQDGRQTTTGPLGGFAFGELVPGRYTLVTTAEGRAAYQKLDLASDLEGLVVNLEPAPELSVEIVEETGAPVSDPQFVVFLARMENAGETPPMKVEARLVQGLMPGRWRFFVVLPETHYLAAAAVGEEDGLEGFDLRPGQKTSATVRVARRAGRITGRAKQGESPARGAHIICYPVSRENQARLGGFRSVRSGLQGEYRFGGLPPGEYRLFAAADDFAGPPPGGPAVKIGPSEELVHDLQVEVP
jgi:hypothetical protein